MIRIVKIETGKKDTFKVTFDNSKSLNVHEDILVKFQLTKDKLFDESSLKALEDESRQYSAFALALRYLSIKMRSTFEMTQYLLKKGIEENEVQNILNRLSDLNYLDDAKYADAFVQTQMKIGNKGKHVLRQQLKLKGISETLINQTLEKVTYAEESLLALKVATTLSKQCRRLSTKESLQKIKLNLMQKGFANESIQFAVQNLDIEKSEDEEFTLLLKVAEKSLRQTRGKTKKEIHWKVQQKLFQKGFKPSKIKEAIEKIEEENDER
ncbi:MAG: RecX family transcriptional regulator [Streptococcaceae bacterium]|jgi:regulatory protein|nr:RecX family transcriptional regulator [Streptococcaceae bacterium]